MMMLLSVIGLESLEGREAIQAAKGSHKQINAQIEKNNRCPTIELSWLNQEKINENEIKSNKSRKEKR